MGKKAKFKKNDVFVHKEQKVTLIIDSVSNMGPAKGYLYDMRVVTDGAPEFKRYYEGKVVEKCDKVKNAKAIKILYGKSTKTKV